MITEKLCAACGEPSGVKVFCLTCWDHLPKQTRKLYMSGLLNVKRTSEIMRERNASVKTLRGRGK
ncbi:MAG: hypothetical protein WC538_22065 [Thermoanaerobaculia bacterium]